MNKNEYLKHLKNLVNPVDFLIQVGQVSPKSINETIDDYRCPCPLHGGDNSTAFSWKKRTGVWSCYSRQCGNNINNHDVYGFLQLKLGLTFKESIEFLEKFLGVTKENKDSMIDSVISKTTDYLTSINKLKQTEIKKLEKLNYLPYFYKEGMSIVNEYLLSRNYRYKDISLFNFYPAKDQFGHLRMGIPIYDENSNLVGVSCRLMDTLISYPSKVKLENGLEYPVPKYKMTKFNKGSILYNLNNAKKTSLKDGLIIVEGQLDVTRLYTYGIYNAVCCMGTFLTQQQTALLHKYCFNITFLVEEGQAAIKGVLQSIKRIDPHIMKISLAMLPSGDADSNRKEVVEESLLSAKTLTFDDISSIKKDTYLV